MATDLYARSKARLSDKDTASLERVLGWLERQIYIGRDYAPKIAANIQNEYNLVGSATTDSSTEYVNFLS